jgi:hypothetical protein
MARDWRSLALAALAAAALALTGVMSVQAQTSAKTAKAAPKKAPEAQQKAADDDEPEELKPEAKPKRKKQDPAEAQRAVEAAAKLLEGGKAEQAVQTLTTTISGGNLPPAIMAKALLYRGMAYRNQQKPAQAISDITGALWLKGGLSPTDRTSALQQRAAAYHEAGLTESGEPLPKNSPPTQARERPAQTSSSWGAATTTSGTDTASASQTSQSGGGWNIFGGGLFGGGSSSSQQQPKQEQAAQPKQEAAPFATTVKPAPEPRASSTSTSSWASSTEVRSAPVAQTREIETASIAPARPEGKFRVQVAMVRSQDEAMAVATKVKRDYAGALAAREPEIDQAVVGNMGSFYRVRVGPFATQNEGQQACAKLKGSGLDCLVVTQ